MTNAFPPSWRNASKPHELHWRTLPARQLHAARVSNWIKAAIYLAAIGFLFGCAIALIAYFTPLQ